MKKIFLKSILLLCALITGTSAWADAVSSVAPEDGKSYVIAAFVSNKYYALPNGSLGGGTISGTEITLNSDNKVNTSVATGKAWTLEEGTGDNAGQFYLKYTSGSDTYYLYKNGTSTSNHNFAVNKTSKNYWSFSTNGTGYTVAAVGRGSNHLNIKCASGTFSCDNSATPIILLEIGDVGGGIPTCATPTFSVAEGTYASTKNVTISTTTEDATIHYTTDGSTPTTSSSTYSTAIPVTVTTTIKAIAVKEGSNNSSVASATYNIVSIAHAGTEGDPYTVADARKAIDALDGTKTNVYVTGIVCTGGSDYGNNALNYWISDDGTETDKLEAYRGKNLNNTNFTANTDVKVGEIVTIKGTLTKFNSTYEFTSGNYLVDHKKKPDTPTFSPAAGAYTSAQNVTITSTEGATIYYTMGDDPATPTSSSTPYTAAIHLDASTTIKAIAIKDGVSSDVATAAYTIDTNPFVTVSKNSINIPATNDIYDDITVTIGNLTNVTVEVEFFESNGTTPVAAPNWINTDYSNNDFLYEVGENTVNSARTAYFKIHATGTEGDAYSELITLTQASANYADLPFSWAGGTSAALNALVGVTSNGLGSDYGDNNAPYRVKMDTKDDYIQIKTNAQIGKVSIGIKMIGGNNESKIKVQESADGSTFTDVEEFTISGSQNSILNFVTSNALDTSSRYVRIIKSKHGSNIGVGPISIAEPGEPALPLVSGTTVTLTTTSNMAGWRTYDNNTDKKYTVDGTTKVYYASATGSSKVTLTEIEGGVPANTTVILHQTSGTEITLTETSNTITAPASNLLQVSTAGQNLGKVYRLGYKSSDGVGFYTYTTASAPAGIIYVETVNSARDFLGFDFDDTTAIEAVKSQKVDGQYFDLQGRKVAQPTKGLYIVNGKKVIVK